MIDINKFSNKYIIRKLDNNDVDIIFNLCKDNPLYYKHCPPFVSIESIKEDLVALPPNKTVNDKFFVGYFNNNELIAVMDFIKEYPNKETCFIGFFMMNTNYQGKNTGTNIINELTAYLKSENYKYIRLGYVKTNSQAKAFWIKNGFKDTGLVSHQELYDIVVLEKKLFD